jgi:hypothetical protein
MLISCLNIWNILFLHAFKNDLKYTMHNLLKQLSYENYGKYGKANFIFYVFSAWIILIMRYILKLLMRLDFCIFYICLRFTRNHSDTIIPTVYILNLVILLAIVMIQIVRLDNICYIRNILTWIYILQLHMEW